MVLKVQVLSFLFSFLYGVFFFWLLEINARFLYSSNLFLKVVISFLFVMFNTLLYFLILFKINYGYVHPYFFLCIIFGYLLCKVIRDRLAKRG